MRNKTLTVRDAILKTFKDKGAPLTPKQIYDYIIEQNIYSFNTDQPLHVVKTRLRRDCDGLNFSASNKKKYFQLLSNGSYWLKGKPIPKGLGQTVLEVTSELNTYLKKEYDSYLIKLRDNLLDKLKHLTANQFEIFCKNFIKVYGFKDCSITPRTKDGGIDGFGKLTIGLTNLDVAFECKRWNEAVVGSDVVRRFRGSIPISCVYGIIFTTSRFSKSAKKEAERDNLKPVVLMNGDDIIQVMIKKEFGIGKEQELTIFVNQIDLVLSD